MRRFVSIAAAVAALSVAGQAAASTVLYSQAYDPLNAGGWSTTTSLRWADSFSLAGDSSVNQVTWYGASYGTLDGALPTTFTIDFYADNAGNPGASLAHLTVNPSATDQGVHDRWDNELYLFSANIAPVALTAGTNYWFSVAVPTTNWVWEESASLCCSALSGDGGQTWTQHPQEEQAFALIGDPTVVSQPGGVPEPAEWALMLSGFFGAGAMLRRRRQLIVA